MKRKRPLSRFREDKRRKTVTLWDVLVLAILTGVIYWMLVNWPFNG